jgi:hypothetical protein
MTTLIALLVVGLGFVVCCLADIARAREFRRLDRETWALICLVSLPASSSRSQRAMWPTTTLTVSDLPRTVRGRPLASAGACGGSYSVGYSPARGEVAVTTDLIPPGTDRLGDA